MMAMWYPVVLAQGFKRPTCRGLDAVGRVELSRSVLEAWVAACPDAPANGDAGGGTVNTNLKRLVSPLGTMASYRGEVRNHWQNPLLVRAASGQEAKVDCEDFAWAAVDLLRSLKACPGVLASKFPRLARLKWSSAEPFLVSGYVYKSGGREAHMWAGLRCGGRYYFVEAVCGPTYAAAGDPLPGPVAMLGTKLSDFFFWPLGAAKKSRWRLRAKAERRAAGGGLRRSAQEQPARKRHRLPRHQERALVYGQCSPSSLASRPPSELERRFCNPDCSGGGSGGGGEWGSGLGDGTAFLSGPGSCCGSGSRPQ